MLCKEAIFKAHQKAAKNRESDPDWIITEREAVAAAANRWALNHGYPIITVYDIERIESLAVGHIDYMLKLSLYVAEMVMGYRPVQQTERQQQ